MANQLDLNIESEMDYCRTLVRGHGDQWVGRDPKTIASYLRLQASNAFGERNYEAAARLGAAATAISWDARNNHEPDWQRASAAMEG